MCILYNYIQSIFFKKRLKQFPKSLSDCVTQTNHPYFVVSGRPLFSVFTCFLKLFVIVLLWRVLCTFLPVVRWSGFIISTPVPFANDPRQNVHFVMKLCWELYADQVGSPCSFAPCYQLHTVIIAAVLRCQGGTLQGQHGPDAVASCRLIDLQFLLWPTRVFPAKILPLVPVIDICSAVGDFSGICARTSRKVIDHFMHVLLQKFTFAAHPSFTAVSIWEEEGCEKQEV